MNRNRIMGVQINRVQCDHTDCLRLHVLRSKAVRDRKWDRVTRYERQLGLCPDQPEDPK